MQHSGGHRLEVVERQFRQGVFRGQHLPLFGDLDPPFEGAAGLGQDRLIGGAATTADRAAASVEDAQADVVLTAQRLQGDLGPVDFPVAGEEARVFVAVGVAEHHLLQRHLLVIEQSLVEGASHHRAHHLWGAAQIFHRFKQWNHLQAGGAFHRINQAGLFGQ